MNAAARKYAPVDGDVGGGHIAGHFEERELEHIQKIENHRGGGGWHQRAVVPNTGQREADCKEPPRHHADSAYHEVL